MSVIGPGCWTEFIAQGGAERDNTFVVIVALVDQLRPLGDGIAVIQAQTQHGY